MAKQFKLQLEINTNFVKQQTEAYAGKNMVMFSPTVSEDYWYYRVKVSKDQAIIGFPKFMQIGIGFAKEKASWNTNLPSTTPARQIFNWIKVNKGDDTIPDSRCIRAIQMIKNFVENEKNAQLN